MHVARMAGSSNSGILGGLHGLHSWPSFPSIPIPITPSAGFDSGSHNSAWPWVDMPEAMPDAIHTASPRAEPCAASLNPMQGAAHACCSSPYMKKEDCDSQLVIRVSCWQELYQHVRSTLSACHNLGSPYCQMCTTSPAFISNSGHCCPKNPSAALLECVVLHAHSFAVKHIHI